MAPYRYVYCAILLFCGTVNAQEVFSVISADGPLSGTVESVNASGVVFVGAYGKKRTIPFHDLRPRDVVRCRRQLLEPDDTEGLFKLGEYCATNGLPNDAFNLWATAAGIKTCSMELRTKIGQSWNELITRVRKKESNPKDPRKALTPAVLQKLPPKTALRLRILAAGKPYRFPEVPWAQRKKLETKHYTIETNVPEMTGKYLMLLLEELYKYYGMRLRIAPRHKLRVLVFASRKDFEQQATAAGHPVGPTTGGFYLQHPEPKKCAIYMPWVMQAGEEPTSVLMHECFHQFYHCVFGKGDPIWLNEGMATYFEASIFDGEKITDAIINRSRLEALQEMLRQGRVDSLTRLLSMDRTSYRGPQYAAGWAFVYWMAWGQPTKQQRTIMQNRLVSFMRSIKDRKPDLKRFEMKTRMKVSTFDVEWKKWVLSLNPDDPFGGKGDPRK